MKKTRFIRSLSLILCAVLLAAVALLVTGCNGNTTQTSSAPDAGSSAPAGEATVTVLGEGDTMFTFTVTDPDKKVTEYEIHTDKQTVGDALLELELIAGEESTYGLYVKTVAGITLDYDTDGKYWAFYVDGAYATAGVDATAVTAGATYAFKAE